VGFLVVGMGLARGGGRGAVGFVVTDCGSQEGCQHPSEQILKQGH